MAKKQFLLLLFPLLIGCNENAPKRWNELIEYKNYIDSETIPFDISKLFFRTSIDTFDARFIRMTYKSRELTGLPKQYFLLKYVKSMDEFHKRRDGEDYISISKELENPNNFKIYAITTISTNKNVLSYIILIRSLNTINKIPYNSIVMFTTQSNKLSSIAEIAYGVENSEKLPPVLLAYKTGNTFLSIQNALYSDMTKDYSLLKIRSWEEFLISIGIKDEHKTVIVYTAFNIDNNGHLEFNDNVSPR
jgi:hypothetical protein